MNQKDTLDDDLPQTMLKHTPQIFLDRLLVEIIKNAY